MTNDEAKREALDDLEALLRAWRESAQLASIDDVFAGIPGPPDDEGRTSIATFIKLVCAQELDRALALLRLSRDAIPARLKFKPDAQPTAQA